MYNVSRNLLAKYCSSVKNTDCLCLLNLYFRTIAYLQNIIYQFVRGIIFVLFDREWFIIIFQNIIYLKTINNTNYNNNINNYPSLIDRKHNSKLLSQPFPDCAPCTRWVKFFVFSLENLFFRWNLLMHCARVMNK